MSLILLDTGLRALQVRYDPESVDKEQAQLLDGLVWLVGRAGRDYDRIQRWSANTKGKINVGED